MGKGKAPALPQQARFTPATSALGPQAARTGLNTPAETPIRPMPQAQSVAPVAGGDVQNQEAQVVPQAGGNNATGNVFRLSWVSSSNAPLVIANNDPPTKKSPQPIPTDDDSYGMLSQDDALFAALDLGDGLGGIGITEGVVESVDDGVGGFIDFDEGNGGAEYESEVDDSMVAGRGVQQHQQGRVNAQQAPQGQQQQPRRVQTSATSGVRKEGSSDSVSEWSEHAAPPASMGGFRFQGGQVRLFTVSWRMCPPHRVIPQDKCLIFGLCFSDCTRRTASATAANGIWFDCDGRNFAEEKCRHDAVSVLF